MATSEGQSAKALALSYCNRLQPYATLYAWSGMLATGRTRKEPESMSDATPETQIDESAAIEYASAKLEEAMAGRGLALMGTPAILHSPDGIYGRAFGAKRLPVADAVFVVELFYQNSSVGGRWISEGTMALNPEIVRDLTKLARTPRK